jgi:hypothetical protein
LWPLVTKGKSNMARAPQGRAQGASAEDDFYEQEDEFGAEGEGGDEQEGQEGGDLPEGAAVDAGEEQEAGGEGALEDELDPDRVERVAGRAVSRIQRLANENRRLQADLAAERERASRGAAPPAQSGPREETDAEFEARVQLLDGADRADARMQRFIAQQQRRDFVNTVQAAAAADRNAYNERAQEDQRMVRWRDRVEEEFNKRLQLGQAVSRIDLFYWLVGKHLAENPKVTAKARNAARQRVDRNTVKPVQGGSDVRPQRRGMDERTARAKRLDGIQI